MPKCDFSNKNEALQVWIENVNVRILEKEKQIEKDFTTRTIGLALK
jgi:hypothetical protein